MKLSAYPLSRVVLKCTWAGLSGIIHSFPECLPGALAVSQAPCEVQGDSKVEQDPPALGGLTVGGLPMGKRM